MKSILPGNPIILYGHSEDETIDKKVNDSFVINEKLSICTMDYRGYGYSDGEYQTSGFTELEDMITVINYLKSKGYEKITYFGKSIGATIGISIAAKFPDLVCVVLDTPILSLMEYFKHQAKIIHRISEKTFDLALPRVLSKIKNDLGIDYKTWIEPKELLPLITQPIYALFYTDDDFIWLIQI